MKLVTYGTGEGALRLGALVDGGNAVLDLVKAVGGSAPAFSSMQALIDAGSEALGEAKRLAASAPRDAVSPLSSVKLAAPLPRPVKARDCSLFLEHMEAAMKKVARQMADADPNPEAKFAELTAPGARLTLNPLFRKKVIYYNCDVLAFSGPEEEIVWPSDSQWMDYELEWACVVGKPGQDVSAARARDHIFGYTIFNDWSARDTQFAVMECNLGPGAGKDFAHSNGIGPCIATPDEFDDPYKLTMTARVNGEEWSRGTSRDMHFNWGDILAHVSMGETLHPGEFIATGTVGSGSGLENGKYLQPGDVIELEVEGLGVLKNRIVKV